MAVAELTSGFDSEQLNLQVDGLFAGRGKPRWSSTQHLAAYSYRLLTYMSELADVAETPTMAVYALGLQRAKLDIVSQWDPRPDHAWAMEHVFQFHVSPLRDWLSARIERPFEEECPVLRIGVDVESERCTAWLGLTVVEVRHSSFPALLDLALRRRDRKRGVDATTYARATISNVRTSLTKAGMPAQFNLPHSTDGLHVLRVPRDKVVIDDDALRVCSTEAVRKLLTPTSA